MDQTIDRLYKVEQEAREIEAKVQTEKNQLREMFKHQRTSYQAELEAKYQESLKAFQADVQQINDQAIDQANHEFNRQLKEIEHALVADRQLFIDNFINELKRIGVNDHV